MADAVGLTIGGVTLVSLFDACMSTFARIDPGKDRGQDYQEAALKITHLGSRLSRWEDLYRTSAPSSTLHEGHHAEAALASIKSSLDRLLMTADVDQPPDDSTEAANTTGKSQTMMATRANTSPGSKTTWVLRDKEEVDEVISSVRLKVEELETLASTIVPTTTQRAESEVKEVGLPIDGEQQEETTRALTATTTAVDPDPSEGVAKVTGYHFEDIVVVGDAKLTRGDSVAEDYSGPIHQGSQSYKTIRAEGNAVVHSGNLYGKSIFD